MSLVAERIEQQGNPVDIAREILKIFILKILGAREILKIFIL